MNFQTLLDYLGPELGLGLEVGLGLGFWLGEGGGGERRRREETGEGERGGSGGKGKEEEESGKHLPEPSRLPPLCLLEDAKERDKKPVATRRQALATKAQRQLSVKGQAPGYLCPGPHRVPALGEAEESPPPPPRHSAKMFFPTCYCFLIISK